MTSKADLLADGWTFHGAGSASATDGKADEKQTPGALMLEGGLGHGDLAQEICASGMLAVPKVLAAMEAARSNAPVQLQGCRGMSMLAEREDTRLQLLDLGGVEAVAAAMAAHPAEAEVQLYGCSALGNLAVGDGEVAVRVCGLPLVLAAMAALPAGAWILSR